MVKFFQNSQGELLFKTSGQKIYEITDNVNFWLKEEFITNGQLNIFIKHTSASLCIQENASKDVLLDIKNFLSKLVPENPSLYTHNIEGKDDMPAHIKSIITQTSLTIPVCDKTTKLLFRFEQNGDTKVSRKYFL